MNPNAKYKYFHDGECIPKQPECMTMCPYNYDPICAKGPSGDFLTFPNQCVLDADNCLNPNKGFLIHSDLLMTNNEKTNFCH